MRYFHHGFFRWGKLSLLFSIMAYSCRSPLHPSSIARNACKGQKEFKLQTCWENSLRKQIEETKDKDVSCQAYLALAENYVDNKKTDQANRIYDRLITDLNHENCRQYAQTEANFFRILSRGKPAPIIHLNQSEYNFQNRELTQSKPVLLFFWATWCGSCQKTFPEISEIYSKYGQKVTIFGISGDSSASDFQKTIELQKMQYKNIRDGADFDGQINRQFFIYRYPTLILLDKTGRVIDSRSRIKSIAKLIEKL